VFRKRTSDGECLLPDHMSPHKLPNVYKRERGERESGEESGNIEGTGREGGGKKASGDYRVERERGSRKEMSQRGERKG
jgi:hypothetical protein